MNGVSYEDRVKADARLIILKELCQQSDGRLNEVSIQHVLDAFAISRTREWIRTQLTRMAELEVIRVTQIGTVMVAQLRQAGRHHVERRAFVDGIAHPSEVD
ncbi:hypothetical protein [Sphingomonas paucimobilis]|uniref:Phage related protein n=1 Tax=Sphingomonas paucimobilis TaxID=13689 RepID=A0A7T3AC93_SPHPI|nr:hypothetical protein [Sphingomonas paucimobilis]QPT09862.1 hypothetical protein I6G38_06370 [Sphingomonas paucimobilis]